MRYSKIPLCPKFEQCEMTKMPLGTKTTQIDTMLTQMQTQVVFIQNLTNKLHRQVEKDSKTDAGTESGFHCGK